MRWIGTLALTLLSCQLYASASQVVQFNTGDVLAKLELTKVQNSYVAHNVYGNGLIYNKGCDVKATQNHVGNVSSSLAYNNVAGLNVEHNVGGTLLVVN